LKEL
jgi:hypothetical protein